MLTHLSLSALSQLALRSFPISDGFFSNAISTSNWSCSISSSNSPFPLSPFHSLTYFSLLGVLWSRHVDITFALIPHRFPLQLFASDWQKMRKPAGGAWGDPASPSILFYVGVRLTPLLPGSPLQEEVWMKQEGNNAVCLHIDSWILKYGFGWEDFIIG